VSIDCLLRVKKDLQYYWSCVVFVRRPINPINSYLNALFVRFQATDHTCQIHCLIASKLTVPSWVLDLFVFDLRILTEYCRSLRVEILTQINKNQKLISAASYSPKLAYFRIHEWLGILVIFFLSIRSPDGQVLHDQIFAITIAARGQ